MSTETLTDFLVTVTQGLAFVRETVLSAVEINNKVMYGIFTVCSSVIGVVFSAIQLFAFLLYNIVVSLIDFVIELLNFGRGLLVLLWKILILVYNLLDLIFHAVESVISFMWSGGKWTAVTIQISAANLAENGLSTWKYFVVSVKELSDSVLGGFITIGQIVKTALIFCWDNLVWCYDLLSDLICCADLFVRNLFKGFIYSCYEFVTDYLYNIPKEAYLGIACCCVLYIILLGIVHHLYSHGLTFPVFSFFHTPADDFPNDYDDYVNGEFSDDDFLDLTQEDDDRVSDNDDDDTGTEDSDDDETEEDDDGELEIDSSNESNTASESEMSEINIQLPPPESRYNFRRSVTPARMRFNNASTTDLEREIETEKEKRKCVVCQDRKKSVLIMPCKHLCLCVQCADHIARARMPGRRVCPLCRTKIKTIMNVYV